MNTIELSLFANRIAAVCDEMGAVLRHAAFSPNIRDRLDYSCAVFDSSGELCAQAAHIPVHLGSMAYAMRDVVDSFDWHAGDVVIFNDPYLGGTHLPDITLVAPLILGSERIGFVANRAHHADIGADSPGSMPISRSLAEEGQIISPTLLVEKGVMLEAVLQGLISRTRNKTESRGDYTAQLSSVLKGIERLQDLVSPMGCAAYRSSLQALNDYAEQLSRTALSDIADGEYSFQDVMDDDGLGQQHIPINVCVKVESGEVFTDFTGTAEQVAGNINCPLSVAAAAVFYVFRCLMPAQVPACAGSFRAIRIHAPVGSLLNAKFPAAVAAGNVETSTRIVDVLLGALAQAIPNRIPAASHGSMNNLAMGSDDVVQPWDYYETIGGGMGANIQGHGQSAVQTHMTNTLNTPIEALEMNYPLRITRYEIRSGSGGQGKYNGGDGLLREFEFLRPAQATLLTERRLHQPWGLQGAAGAKSGANYLNDEILPGKVEVKLVTGDRLRIETAGGGGFATA